MDLKKIVEYKDQVVKKFEFAYFSLGLAGMIFFYKLLFSKNKSLSYDEKSKKRRKASRKIRQVFDFKNEHDAHIRFTQKNHLALDNYSKLKEYSSLMINKALVKEEISNSKLKQDYIFYQILNGMQNRFKQKTIVN